MDILFVGSDISCTLCTSPYNILYDYSYILNKGSETTEKIKKSVIENYPSTANAVPSPSEGRGGLKDFCTDTSPYQGRLRTDVMAALPFPGQGEA